MVSKKILGVAIAAAFSSQAFAALDLTLGTNGAGAGAVTYAKESILSSQVSNSMVQLTAAGNELNTVVAAGFGITATTHAFIRFDLTNAKFKTAVATGDLIIATAALGAAANSTGTITNVAVAQGGAVGDSYVIFDVTSGGIGQTDQFLLKLAGLQVSPTAPVTVSYAHYSTSPNAVSQTGALASDSYQGISVANALTTVITATDATADVSASPAFTKFTGNTATAGLGKVQFKLTAGTLTAVGGTVTALNQLIDITDGKSALSVTGDLSFTTDTSAALTAGNLTFGAQASNTASSGNTPTGKTDKFTTAAYTVNTDYTISVTAKSAINAGAYSLTFAPTSIANAQYGATGATAALGSITRGGTTVQVPYLTTLADYNQRLVLVNRSNLDAPYTITFTPEANVTANAKAAATGTLAKGKTLILKAADLVDLVGATRTAATVVITAPNSTIDAATTLVNLADKSTDTVKLQ